jgi:integrase
LWKRRCLVIGRLNAKKAKEAKPGKLCDGGGLWLYTGRKSKSWVFRYMIVGKAVEMGIGSYDDLDLDEAREAARKLRLQVRRKDEDGGPVDILAVRRAEYEYRMENAAIDAKKAMTFRDCADGYLKANANSWKNPKHRQQWFNTLETYVYPHLGDMPVKRLDVGDVVRALQPIWHQKAETARRVRMRIETILEWAIAANHYVGDNPAKRTRVKHLLGAQTDVVCHHDALPYEQMGDFITALTRFGGIGALPLELCVLTATRTSETLLADWSEIDWTKRTWTIPGKRRKGKNGDTPDLTVPLSDRCVEIFRQAAQLTGSTGLVFRGNRGRRLSENTLLDTLEQLGRNVTVHGFRSSFRDWAGDCTAYPREIIEAALGHKVGNDVELAYRRRTALEKRRHLMRDWSMFCAAPSVEAGTVIPIGATR